MEKIIQLNMFGLSSGQFLSYIFHLFYLANLSTLWPLCILPALPANILSDSFMIPGIFILLTLELSLYVLSNIFTLWSLFRYLYSIHYIYLSLTILYISCIYIFHVYRLYRLYRLYLLHLLHLSVQCHPLAICINSSTLSLSALQYTLQYAQPLNSN